MSDRIKTLPRVFKAHNASRSARQSGPCATTPKKAAVAFFEHFPKVRMIGVQEYGDTLDGGLTFIMFDKTFQSWRNLNKAAALALPDEPSKYPAAYASEPDDETLDPREARPSDPQLI